MTIGGVLRSEPHVNLCSLNPWLPVLCRLPSVHGHTYTSIAPPLGGAICMTVSRLMKADQSDIASWALLCQHRR